jgi:hypothetical protein
MPKYFFHFHDGDHLFDEQGEDLINDHAAKRDAEALAYELAGEFGPGAWITVTKDDSRDPLFEIRIEDAKRIQ